MAVTDPNIQAQIEALTRQTKDRTQLYHKLAQLISDLRTQLDQETFNEQVAALGHNLIADRFLAWLTGGNPAIRPSLPPVTLSVGDRTFIIDFTGTDPRSKKSIR